MCACYFRAQGENFDVDAFLSDSPWKSMAEVQRRGGQKSIGSKPRNYSSITLSVTDDDQATVHQQIQACLSFIQQHEAELLRLNSHLEVEVHWFALGYYLPIGEVYAVCPYFDGGFLSALVSVGAEFEFAVMCCSVE